MAVEKFNADIELLGHKITQVRIDPMSNSQRISLSTTLGISDKGRVVYDEDEEVLYVWNGLNFIVGNIISDWSTITNKPSTFPPDSHQHVEADITDLDKYTQSEVDTLLGEKIDSSEKGIPAGVATLGIDGKVPTSQLPESVQGDMTYKGGWNANTNTPTISSGVGENGDFYRVITAGSTVVDGINDWQVGDSLIFNIGTNKWEKFDGSGVNSVFGRQGNVTAQAGDYNATKITNDSSVSGSSVKDALNNLNSSKSNTGHTHEISDVNNLQNSLNNKLENIVNQGVGIGLVLTKSGVNQGVKRLLGINGITISDSNSNADTVEISGLTPSSALANSDHASILNINNTASQSIPALTNVKVNSWDSNGPSQQGVIPSFGLGRLTIGVNGTYLISILGVLIVSNNTPTDVTIRVYKNGSQLSNFKTTVTVNNNVEKVPFYKTLPITASASDYFEVFISHSGTLTTNILVSNSVLYAVKQDVANGFATWGNISGTLSNQTDLQSALDSKAALNHEHVEADITDLDKYTQAEVDSLLSGKAALNHTHSSNDIDNDSSVSGTTITDALNTLLSSASTWGNISGTLSNQTDLQSALDSKLNSSLKGAINGVAELDSSGRLPVAQLPTSVMEYKGVWNATTNTPTLSSGVGNNGDCYLVSIAGSVNLDGENEWGIGDAVIFNGTLGQWQKVGRDDLVTSVFGRIGAITAQAGDYDASQIDNDSSVVGSSVKDALNTLLGSSITNGDKGDITVSSGGTVWTIDNDVVSFDKIQNIQTNRVLARSSSGVGNVEELTLPQFRTLINVEDGADVTDSVNVDAAGAVMNTDTSTASMQFVIDEDTMVSNSDTKVPTQQSVKAYVDGKIASSVTYQGGYNATSTPNSSSLKGYMYTVTVAGNASGFWPNTLEVGDVIIAEVNSPATQTDWTVVNKDLDAASIKVSYESNPDTNAYTNADKTKVGYITVTQAVNLDTIEADVAVNNAKVSNVTTNLSIANRNTSTLDVVSSDGTDATIPAATTSLSGLMTSSDKTKLDSVASNANNYVHPNHTGDVTSTGDGATVIANDVVTNTKLANMATSTIKGRVTAATGDPEDLTPAQVRNMLNVADGAKPKPTLTKTITLAAPTASDNITIFRTDVAITVVEVIAVSTGTTPSTTYQLKHHPTRSSGGFNLTTSAATTSVDTGNVATLSVPNIAADSWIWLTTTAASGTNVYLTIDIRYTED